MGDCTDGLTQFKLQTLSRHLDHIVADRTRRCAQVSACIAVHEQDVAFDISGHRGGRINFEQSAMAQLADAANPTNNRPVNRVYSSNWGQRVVY